MAFIKISGNTIAFADYEDVLSADHRLFEDNEGLTETVVEDALTRSTERILTRVRASNWWRNYYTTQTGSTPISVPALDPNKVIARQNDFTELCVCIGLAEYILPKVADFGEGDKSEKNKMSYYASRAEQLYTELIQAGDWYDFDGAGVVSNNEIQKGFVNRKRVR